MKTCKFTTCWRELKGKDTYIKLILVHLFCHHHIHTKTARAMSDRQHFSDQDLLAEEKLRHRPSRQEKSYVVRDVLEPDVLEEHVRF